MGNGLKDLPLGLFLAWVGVKKAVTRCTPKFVVLLIALAANVATFALAAHPFAAAEETISIEVLLKSGWQIAGYTSTLDDRSAFILFRHPDET